MQVIYRPLLRIILLTYLISSYLSATHMHKDILQQHNSCKVYILTNNLHGKDIDHSRVVLNCGYFIVLAIPKTTTSIVGYIKSGFNLSDSTTALAGASIASGKSIDSRVTSIGIIHQ